MITKTSSKFIVDKWGRVMQSTTNHCKTGNVNFAVESQSYKGKTLSKQYIMWNDNFQKIVNKVRNKDGKFEVIG